MNHALHVTEFVLIYLVIGFFGTSLAHIVFKRHLYRMDGISLTLGTLMWPILGPIVLVCGVGILIHNVCSKWIKFVNSFIEPTESNKEITA